MARFIDASHERLQVTLSGAHPRRYVLACNGHRVPLQDTATHGRYVAGVRYKVSNPPATLHPTVWPVQALVFDVIDTWTGRSIGGCTYHVAHPGGQSYERFPANALEAEGRRTARFYPFGHTPGPMEAPPEERNPDFPLTLDLRRPGF
jgi:uncharacterized protein (DUF2126 family)